MRRFWVVPGGIVLVVAVVFGPTWWGQFYYWLHFGKGDEATKTQAISAGVQAAAAVILLGVTAYYAFVTRQALDAAKKQAEATQRQFDLAQKQFEWTRKESECSARQEEQRRKDFALQLQVAQSQLELSQRQFKASMIPRLFLSVYPTTESYRYIGWEIKNLSNHDLLIRGAEICWNEPLYEWRHVLSQYPGGVFAPGDELSSKEYNVVPIPEEKWPKGRQMVREDVIRMLTLSLTVSDVAGLLSFRFEFTPGKGQSVTVLEEKSVDLGGQQSA